VTKGRTTPTILIVDDDLGFVWWLGQVLTEAGYQAVPALRCRDVAPLVEELNLHVDLVIANPDLPGASPMIRGLVRGHLALKVVLVGHPASDVISRIQADAILERPSRGEIVSRSEWVRKLRKILKQAGITAAG
jgi:DNA-binding NtrC family response regulator